MRAPVSAARTICLAAEANALRLEGRKHGTVGEGKVRTGSLAGLAWHRAKGLRARADGACELINIKLNRVGGLSRARRIRDFALEAGIDMLIMETGGTVLADTAAVHLAQATPPERVRGTWLCHEMLDRDLAPGQGACNAQGRILVPGLPGLGVEPDLALLGEPAAVYR